MKTVWITVVLAIAALVVCLLGFRACQRAGWESTLRGPYEGVPFAGDLTNQPVSVLPVSAHAKLEVYEVANLKGPVLLLRSDSGRTVWSRLLVPMQKFDGEQIERASVRELRLLKSKRRSGGYEVSFSCDWDWGGREGGLINLDKDYGFKSFRISW